VGRSGAHVPGPAPPFGSQCMPEGHVILSHVLTSLAFRNHGACSPAQETMPAPRRTIPAIKTRSPFMSR
jgi:hypothetical protein